MTEPVAIARLMGWTALLTPVGLFVCLCFLQAYDLVDWIKADISTRRKVRAFCRLLPKHIYYMTDWPWFGRAVLVFTVLLPLVTFVGSLLAVGFAEVFL